MGELGFSLELAGSVNVTGTFTGTHVSCGLSEKIENEMNKRNKIK